MKLYRLVLALLVAALIPACSGSSNTASGNPPSFNGVTGATSPAVGQAMLTWAPAIEFVTGTVTYNVAWSLTPGTEVFGSTDSTITFGPASVLISSLTSVDTYYFIVQAVDGSGNTDANSPPPEISVKIQ